MAAPLCTGNELELLFTKFAFSDTVDQACTQAALNGSKVSPMAFVHLGALAWRVRRMLDQFWTHVKVMGALCSHKSGLRAVCSIDSNFKFSVFHSNIGQVVACCVQLQSFNIEVNEALQDLSPKQELRMQP